MSNSKFLNQHSCKFLLRAIISISILSYPFYAQAINSSELKNLAQDSIAVGQQLETSLVSYLSKKCSTCMQLYKGATKKTILELLHFATIAGLTVVTHYAWGELNHVIQEEIYPGFSNFNRREYFVGSFPGWALPLISSVAIFHAARAGKMPQLSVKNLAMPAMVGLGARGLYWTADGLLRSKSSNHRYSSPNHTNIFANLCEFVNFFKEPLITLGICAWILHKRNSLIPTNNTPGEIDLTTA